MKKIALVIAVLVAVGVGMMPAIAPADAGQWDDNGKGPCWTWGNVTNVNLARQQSKWSYTPVLYVTMRDWNGAMGWFDYFTVSIRNTAATPLAAAHEQAASALGNPMLAVQVKTAGACRSYLYNPVEFDVYDVTPVEVEPPETTSKGG